MNPGSGPLKRIKSSRNMGRLGGQFVDRFKTLKMHDRSAVAVISLIVPLIAGCAQIRSFSVIPSTICRGETVEINWKASGKVELSVAPPLEGAGEGEAEESRSFTPEQNTRFTLRAPGLLKSDQREWDVQVIPGQHSRLLGGIAQCGGNPPFVSTSFTIQQKDTSSRVRAVSIANNYNRELSVSKEEVEVEIPPNGTTDRFKTTSITGTWTVRIPVAPDENCDNALEAVRGRLTIKTQMSCVEGFNGRP
jgi:hypothetical protein